jgi:monomeric sarcosine oxidase
MISRRRLLKGVAALPLLAPSAPAAGSKPHVAVIGAGAFGGWTALHLLRQGARVSLVDAWGPGNSRASSGGETRVIRATYGPDLVYVEMVIRSLTLWQEHEKRWNVKLYRRTGVLWMPARDDRYVKPALPFLREARLPFEELDTAAASKRFPQINWDGVPSALYEKEAGYLLARRACAVVLKNFLKEGGEFRQVSVAPGAIRAGRMSDLVLPDNSRLSADQYVFACGPWLSEIFPDVLGKRINPTRQEVFFFGTPAGDPRFLEDRFPVWIDDGPHQFYGIPGNEWRGFKVASDIRGTAFDPTAGSRMPTPEGLKAARDYLAFRFPALRGAPLVENRVCQYEDTPDAHFILDRHPHAENVWLAGGGSGHGFKLGPAVGEHMADLVLGKKPVDRFFALSRFSK